MARNGAISIDFVITDGKDGLRRLTMDADALRRVMEENVRVADKFQKSYFGFAAVATGVQTCANSLQQLTSVMHGLTAESESFSHAMKAANTMAGKDAAGFSKLKDEVTELAGSIPLAREELANGLYQVVSNGVPEDNWITFLQASARSAVGGIADLGRTVTVTSTLIKNYGLEWEAAQGIQDKIQLTAQNGVTSFEQLSQALPRVAGNAATLGVSVDELMASFATLTGVSGNTAEVSTQLAAIFTALVKPSSEAGRMAEEMGVQFDAAAIRAAGGFQNFLQQLDGSISAYSAATGTLEQEVYGRLFGSAEALRALIPLTGELSNKFTANVAAMENSAGTMDVAFAEMSSTGEAAAQTLRNKWASFTDFITEKLAAIQPYTDFGSGFISTAASAFILVKGLKELNIVTTATAAKAGTARLAMAALGYTGNTASAAIRVLSATMRSGAYSATTFKIALKGLMITTGVGAAIAALTTLIEYLCNTADDAADQLDELSDSTARIADAQRSCDNVMSQTLGTMESEAAKLRILMQCNIDTSAAVEELNDKYGDIFGSHKTAAEWYDILITKSKDYAKMLGLETKMKELGVARAEALLNKEKTAEAKADWEKINKSKMRAGRRDPVLKTTEFYSTDDTWKALRDNLEKYGDDVTEFDEEMNRVASMMSDLSKESGISLPGVTGAGTTPVIPQEQSPTGGKPKAEEKTVDGSIAQYNKLAGSLKKQLENINPEIDPLTFQNLTAQIAEVENQLSALERKKRHIKMELDFPDVSGMTSKEIADTIGHIDIAAGIKLPEKLPEFVNPIKSDAVDSVRNYTDAMGGLVNVMEQLQGPTEDTAAAWLEWISNLLSSIAQAIPALKTLVAGNTAAAASGAAASVASTPWVGWLLAGAATASVLASLAKLPKFAEGGIVSGPTVGLIGEYAGASNNPEVVAPLDKLRSMLQPAGGMAGGVVRFEIKGRTLVGIIEKETNIKHRS